MTKNRLLLMILALFIGFGIPGVGMAYTIGDGYWGGNPTGGGDRDVIGEESLFGVSGIDIVKTGAALDVTIYSGYFDNLGAYDTYLGDFFISTDGWNPVGSAPYVGDYFGASGAEDWEYVVRLTYNNVTDSSGIALLYAVEDESGIKKSIARSGYQVRADQEITYTPIVYNSEVEQEPIGSEFVWAISGTSLSFEIPYEFTGINDFGFHWTMSCANDVIEGGHSVPEPSLLLLLGTGLVGLAGFRRKSNS